MSLRPHLQVDLLRYTNAHGRTYILSAIWLRPVITEPRPVITTGRLNAEV